MKSLFSTFFVLFFLVFTINAQEEELEMESIEMDEMDMIEIPNDEAPKAYSIKGYPTNFSIVGEGFYLRAKVNERHYGNFSFNKGGKPMPLVFPDSLSNPYIKAEFKDWVYFIATVSKSYSGLYKYHPKTGQFVFLKKLSMGSVGVLVPFVVLNDKLYFTAKSPDAGTELWQCDGTSEGTFMLSNVSKYKSDRFKDLILYNGRLYFYNNYKLFVSEGKPGDTKEVVFENPVKYMHIAALCPSDKGLFISTSGSGKYLYLLDDKSLEAKQVKAWPDVDSMRELLPQAIGDKVYFTLEDPTSKKHIIWESNGSEKGTKSISAKFGDFQNVLHLTAIGDNLFFSAQEGQSTNPWCYNPKRKKAFKLASTSSSTKSKLAYNFMGEGNKVFFISDFSPNRLLWTTDGSPEGTYVLKEERSKGELNEMIIYQGKLYFSFNKEGSYERELWVSDGTKEGTALYHDF